MFTGIIEGSGIVQGLRPAGGGKRLAVTTGFDLVDTKIGDSIAVNGACLTVVAVGVRRFEADVAPETLSRTTLGRLGAGERVNLERALRFSDRLDGHLVTGHIDGTGVIQEVRRLGNAVIIRIQVGPDLSARMVEKGSLAVDGISLTINACGRDFAELSIIPHTAGITTIGTRAPGDAVNLETDIIGKYVARFLSLGSVPQTDKRKESEIDKAFLARAGFM